MDDWPDFHCEGRTSRSIYNILDSFNLVNKKGFVPKKDPNPLIPIVYEFLRRKGYKFKDFCFGANENTYRLSKFGL